MQNEKLKYRLTPEDLASVWYAQRDNPGAAFFGTPQERSNKAWKVLGEKYGFDWETVQLDEEPFILATPNAKLTGRSPKDEA
jgi:hypothetical protein